MGHQSKNYNRTFAKGLFRHHPTHKKFKAGAPRYKHAVVALALPGQLDLRDKTAPCEDQSSCGSCWAFSVTNALRSAYMLIGKDPGALSKNYLLLNAGPGPNEMGCNGGDFDSGQNMLSGHGPCLEQKSPYRASDRGSYPDNAGVAATASQWVLVGDGENRPTAEQLCEALWHGGVGACLSVDVAADNNWSNYSDGIYSDDSSRSIDHMVRIVGYNAETSIDTNGKAKFDSKGEFANGDGYFIVRNNWNESWGQNGCMLSRYAANNLAETAMLFLISDTPIPPPPEPTPVPPPTPVPVPPIPPTPPPAPKPFICHFFPWLRRCR